MLPESYGQSLTHHARRRKAACKTDGMMDGRISPIGPIDRTRGAGDASAMLAIIWHSRTGAARALAEAAHEGARAASPVELVRAADADPGLMLAAQGYIFACPENLGTMSGEMKEFFDRCYYPLLGQIEGRPYATLTAAGSDGRGALAQLDRIVTGWRLRRVVEPVIANLEAQTPEAILRPKVVPPTMLQQSRELGQAMGEGLALGVF